MRLFPLALFLWIVNLSVVALSIHAAVHAYDKKKEISLVREIGIVNVHIEGKGCKLYSPLSLNIIEGEGNRRRPSSSAGQFFPLPSENGTFFQHSNFCFNSMSWELYISWCVCVCTLEMCNEEVFIFFSAAWFLLPLVMLLAFYKHFFLLSFFYFALFPSTPLNHPYISWREI